MAKRLTSGLKLQKRWARKLGETRPLVLDAARTSKYDFIKAIKGTGGNRREIAERMGVCQTTVYNLLRRPDWADIAAMVVEEEQAVQDALVSESIRAIQDAVTQRTDIGVAASTAKWYLSKTMRPVFGDDGKVVVDGGPNPIRVIQVQIPADILNQSLEAKKAALAIAEEEERRAEKQIESKATTPTLRIAG
jgi:hypothetical protein